MTVIRPNSISGVTSITAQGGGLNIFRSNGTAGDLTINNIVGGAATFTGVLTYEDVTNVDSIGVITARSGIRIGATGANTLITGNGTGIGIGITTPTEELHIRAATPVIRLEDGDNAKQSQIVGSDGNLRLDADNNNAIADTNIAFRTDGGERLRIGPVGQIGIGGANYGTSGQVLTSQGSGSAVQWANAGGITHARGYRLNNTPDASGGTIDLTNWAYEDSAFNGHLGSGWSLPSSGVFTFPTTGIYDVSMMGMMRQASDSNAWCGVQGKATTNNSSYSIAFECYQQIVQASGSSNQYVNFYGHCILDVTNTSNVKFKVSFFADQNEQVYLHGGGSYNQTALKFTRLGDT